MSTFVGAHDPDNIHGLSHEPLYTRVFSPGQKAARMAQLEEKQIKWAAEYGQKADLLEVAISDLLDADARNQRRVAQMNVHRQTIIDQATEIADLQTWAKQLERRLRRTHRLRGILINGLETAGRTARDFFTWTERAE